MRMSGRFQFRLKSRLRRSDVLPPWKVKRKGFVVCAAAVTKRLLYWPLRET